MAESQPSPREEAPPRPGLRARLRRSGRARTVLVVAALAVALAAVLAWHHFAGRESTDDAQVDGHVNPVAARVGGTVAAVLVEDNQLVEQGTLLVRIDPRDYAVAVARAQADLAENEASAKAASTTVPLTSTTSSSKETAAGSGVAAAQARHAASEAQLRQAQARERQAAQDVERLRPLLAKDEISTQQFDVAATAADAARAAREAAEAEAVATDRAVEAARAQLAEARTGREQVGIASARAASASAKVEMARAALEQAQLNLSYTDVKAPVRGVVSRRTVEVGQVVQAGQPLLAIVPLEDVWITANFKEGQLKQIRPAQRVDISVDAYGGRTFHGHVDSISAATGARFSLLPPENATGNYVKVVQRVPVKIVLDQGTDPDHLLRPGMSVTPTVYVR
jgi:membrane fusion protein, multidrug efflux system